MTMSVTPGATPTLTDTIRTVLDAVLTEVNVCLPGKIVAYDPTTQMADIQPVLKKKYEDGSVVLPAVIPNVPVKQLRANAGKTFIHIPLVPNDDVTLVFSQRSLDNWKTQGGITDPADRRKFNISDAFALIGGSAKPDSFKADNPLAIEIANQLGLLQVLPDGTIKLNKAPLGTVVKPNGEVDIGNVFKAQPTGEIDLGIAPANSAAIGEFTESRLAALEAALTAFVIIYNAHVHNIITPVPGSPTGIAIAPNPPFVPVPTPVSSVTIKVSL